MDITAAGYGDILTSFPTQASASGGNQLQEKANAALLGEVLDFQKEMAAQLLQSMGVGQNIDVEV